MNALLVSHLSDFALLRNLSVLVARDRTTTAEILAHISEVDSRRLYLPAGYPSMYLYCVNELRLSEEAAYKRIHAGRAAQRFPDLFTALIDGRLNLTSIVVLAPHLTDATADELIAAAANKTKSQIELLVAERFPRTELLPMVQPVAEPVLASGDQHAPGRVPMTTLEHAKARFEGNTPDAQHAPGRVDHPATRAEIKPLAPQRFELHVSIDKNAHDLLRQAQDLLGQEVPAGDIAAVLERALAALVAKLEKRKFASTSRPSTKPRPTTSTRHVPAHVKRAVRERDGGQCTFVGESGKRCPARARLELDHIEPVARGGQATTDNMRLRCRAHNQFAAECEFGAQFMNDKRQAARDKAVTKARSRAVEREHAARAASTA